LHADDTRIVEEDVEPAPAAVRLRDHPLDILAARDVRANRDLVELRGDFLHSRVEVGQHDPGTVGREPPRACRADPALRAGDQHRSSVELSHLAPPERVYIRTPGAHTNEEAAMALRINH